MRYQRILVEPFSEPPGRAPTQDTSSHAARPPPLCLAVLSERVFLCIRDASSGIREIDIYLFDQLLWGACSTRGAAPGALGPAFLRWIDVGRSIRMLPRFTPSVVS